MISQPQLGDVVVDVVQKDIKNLHLRVHPPTGRVTISAPLGMKTDAIRGLAVTKLGWRDRPRRGDGLRNCRMRQSHTR